MKTKLLPLLFCLLSTLPALADSFWVNGICYYITGNKTVAVTEGDNNGDGQSDYSGNINIPAQIQYNNQTYSVTAIDSYAFYRCAGLTAVTIPNSVTEIGTSAFSHCSSLQSITLPNSVTEINDRAFDSSGLTDIYCEAEVPPICYEYTFARDTYLNGVLHVPAVAVEAYHRAEGWTRFANIVGFDNSDIEEPTWQDAVTIEAESTQALFVPYIWASSNEDVASVNQNGVITAIAPGTCTITLTCGETVYSCEVTVSNKSTGQTEISNVSPTKVYDLQGRRVSNPRRGIFIINGQKTLMK